MILFVFSQFLNQNKFLFLSYFIWLDGQEEFHLACSVLFPTSNPVFTIIAEKEAWNADYVMDVSLVRNWNTLSTVCQAESDKI